MGSLYRLKQKFVDFCNTTNQIEDSTLTVPTSHVVYGISNHLDILEYSESAGQTELDHCETIRTKMQTIGINSFVGEMQGSVGTRWHGYAVFNSTYTDGVIIRTAYANRFMIKYRYQNEAWISDNYFSAPVLLWTNPNPTSDFEAQAINTNTNYSYYIVTFKGHKSYANKDEFIYRLENGTTWNSATWIELGTSHSIWSRNFKLHVSGIVTFENAITVTWGSSTFSTNTERMIPLHIYGCDSVS